MVPRLRNMDELRSNYATYSTRTPSSFQKTASAISRGTVRLRFLSLARPGIGIGENQEIELLGYAAQHDESSLRREILCLRARDTAAGPTGL